MNTDPRESLLSDNSTILENNSQQISDDYNNLKSLPVYLRLKPRTANNNQEPFLTVVPGLPQVIVDPPKDSRYKAQEAFSFNGIFRESCGQIDVYKSAVLPLVQTALKNHNDALLFSMGSSGSGKTHTILGHKQTPGMIHLALDTLFKSIHRKIAEFETAEEISDKIANSHRTSQAIEAGIVLDWGNDNKSNQQSPNHNPSISINNLLLNSTALDDKVDVSDKYTYAVYISMVEIYNDRIFDLYGETNNNKHGTNRRAALLMKTDPNTGKTFLADVRKLYVSGKEEAFKTIEHGLSVRAAHATGSNTSSSRSHAFIIIEIKRISKSNSTISSSTLTIADLAGSERVKTARTQGNRLVESCAINKSLMLLGQCLQKQRGSSNNPLDTATLRSSKLTQLLLSNAFNSKLHQRSVLLVNIDRYGDFNTASQILRYSALAREVSVPQTRIPSLSSISSGSGSATLIEVSDYDDDPQYVDQDLHKFSLSTDPFHLIQKIEELEIALSDSQQHALLIEEQVREEMANEMDARMKELSSHLYDRLEDETGRGQQLIDRKLELLHSIPIDTNREYQILEQENRRLRAENMRLQLQLSQLPPAAGLCPDP